MASSKFRYTTFSEIEVDQRFYLRQTPGKLGIYVPGADDPDSWLVPLTKVSSTHGAYESSRLEMVDELPVFADA